MCYKYAGDEACLNLHSCFSRGAGVCPRSTLVFGIYVAHIVMWLCRHVASVWCSLTGVFISQLLAFIRPQKKWRYDSNYETFEGLTMRVVWWPPAETSKRLICAASPDNITHFTRLGFVISGDDGNSEVVQMTSHIHFWGLISVRMLTSEIGFEICVMSLICRVSDEMTRIMTWICFKGLFQTLSVFYVFIWIVNV